MTTAPEITADPLADVAERFANDVAKHEMTIFHDGGLYRHLRFVHTTINERTGKPERSSSYYFDLITWPGHLAIDGDMGGFMFARTEDMFEFFRGQRINPGYWAEKLRGPGDVKDYSEDKFRKIITEHITDDGAGNYPSPVQTWPGLADAVEREIFTGADIYHEQGARAALDDFTFGDKFDAECHCGEKQQFTDSFAARSWPATHSTDKNPYHWAKQVTTIKGFRFTGTWDFADWSYQYLWCLHAIQWGIRQYDLSKAAVLAAALSGQEVPAL